MSYRWLLLVFLTLGLLGATDGCRRATPQDSSKLPVFTVSVPVQREVTDYVEYTGRTGAVQAEEVKARVTGFLMDAPFQEGAEFKQNDVLFKIDDRPYKAQFDQAEAQVGLYESQLKLAKANYERDKELYKRTNGAGVSQQALDADAAQQEQAEAAVKAAKASLEVYTLNLNYCTVKSPIDGQVGRSNQPIHNLIMQDSTLLTTVQSVDPMYVYFDMDMPSCPTSVHGFACSCCSVLRIHFDQSSIFSPGIDWKSGSAWAPARIILRATTRLSWACRAW